jgi:hypothetical protein
MTDRLPLGLKCDFAAPSGAVERLDRLAAYDLSFLDYENRLVRESGGLIRPSMQEIAKDELRRFLSFPILKSGEAFVPSAQVDKAWHVLIIHTRRYRSEICRNILGIEYFDHTPRCPTDPLDDKGFDRTLALYRAAYGEPPAAMWQPVRQPPMWRPWVGLAACLGLFVYLNASSSTL